MYKLSTSMMCADPFTLQSTLPIIDKHTDFYHIDIMDGHFVPNLALSLDYVRSLKQHSTKPIEVHLMVSHPQEYLDELISINVQCISFHYESIQKDAFRLFKKVKDAGINVGIVINPSERIETIELLLPKLDKVTMMTVEPGFAGQSMIEEVLPKIKKIKELKIAFGYSFVIEVDGSNNFKTFDPYRENGAEQFILGTGLFAYPDLAQGFREIRQHITKKTSSEEAIVGMDIGGTYTRIGIVDRQRNLHHPLILSTNELVEHFNETIIAYVEEHRANFPIIALSMGFPGIVDAKTLEVIAVPNQHKLVGKDYLPELATSLGLPIYLDKDTNFLFTNDLYDLGLQDTPSVLAFYLGTGYGNAIRLNHEIFVGDHGIAGEIGHIPMRDVEDHCGCGGIGCVETRVSGTKLRKIQTDSFPDCPIGQLFTQHTSSSEIQAFIRDFALTIATEITLLDVSTIIVGGGVVAMADFPRADLEKHIHAYLRSDSLRDTLNVHYAHSHPENGVIGAALHAFAKGQDQ